MKFNRFYFLAIGFCILLVLPSLDQWLKFTSHFRSTEKRRLATMPDLTFTDPAGFVRRFNSYYRENFGWRNALFYIYCHWKFTILHQSPLPHKVVVGKNGWFYPGNDMNYAVNKHRGLMPLADSLLQHINGRLQTYQQEFARRGICLYLLIAPDSYTIYPEYLPVYIKPNGHTAQIDQFEAYMGKHSAIPLIDLRETLLANKRRGAVYYKTDTHWNDLGALSATIGLTKRIRQDFPAIPVVTLSDYKITKVSGEGGDLVTMMAMNNYIQEPYYYHITAPNGLVASQVNSIPDTEGELPISRFVLNNPRLPKILLWGDSFSYSMNQFVSGFFRESYMVPKGHIHVDLQLVEAEKPDIVVIQIVERNLDWLVDL